MDYDSLSARAARATQQWNDDAARRTQNERIYGPGTTFQGGSVANVGGFGAFATIGGMLGGTLGAIASHDAKISTLEGALSGAFAGFVFCFLIGLVVLTVLRGLGAGFAVVRKVLGFFRLSGLIGAVLRGALFGAVAGLGLCLWLNETVDYYPVAMLRVAAIGAAGGFVVGLYRKLKRKPAAEVKTDQQVSPPEAQE